MISGSRTRVLPGAFALLLAMGCGGGDTAEVQPPVGELPSPGPTTPATGEQADSVGADTLAEGGSAAGAERGPRAGGAPVAAEGATAPVSSPTGLPPSAGTEPSAGRQPTAAPAQDEGARILRSTAQAYESIRSLQADFTMELNNPLLRNTTTSRGTLYQRRPDRLLLRFTEPQGDVIVSDGTYFWVYYPSVDAQQVLRAPAAQAGTGGVDLQAQFVGDPVARFDYTLHGREQVAGRAAHVITMVPKENLGYRRLEVWIDTEDGLVRRFELTDDNDVMRRFELRNLRVDPTLSDALFRFTPPPDARIVDRG